VSSYEILLRFGIITAFNAFIALLVVYQQFVIMRLNAAIRYLLRKETAR
jgi:hypothetical protein